MSLELGRSSSARDDDSESTDVNDAAAESGAEQPPDEGTADRSARRSVLAPFMLASGADDSLPEEASGDPDEASGDPPTDTGKDEAPERGDAVSPAADVEADDEDATAAPPGDEGTAATPDAGGTTGSSVPRQGDTDDRSTSGTTSGAGSALRGAAGAATGAASSIPAPRSAAASPGSATAPRMDSGGQGKAGADIDGPLLVDAGELRANWLRLQAGFVDDPHEAVSDAADLVEHAAQALVGALRMRQQKLREAWDGGRPRGSGTADADENGQGARPPAADTTEQLRLLMRRYRVLFNHICGS